MFIITCLVPVYNFTCPFEIRIFDYFISVNSAFMCISYLISSFTGIGTGIGTKTMIVSMQGDKKEIVIMTKIGTETWTGTATDSEMKGIMSETGIEIENGKVGIGIEGTGTVLVEETVQGAEATIAGNGTEMILTTARVMLVAALAHIGA